LNDRERAGAVVFVVDDDLSMREALSSLLRSVGWRVQIFSEAVAFLAHERPAAPSCLVLDVRLPGMSGLELQLSLAALTDAPPIIFMTAHGSIPMSVQAMKDGAFEFLAKPFREQDLLDAVDAAIEQDARARRGRAEIADIRRRVDSLSRREHEVMSLIVKGLLNKQAAALLEITEITIKVHRRRVMQKMGARSLPELVRLVERVEPMSA
jgi:FixJ family two-component response regulator